MTQQTPATDPARRVAPPGTVQRIADDAEALAVARELAAVFRREAAERDRQRRLPWDELDLYSRSGLGAITVPRAHGGADVSYRTLAEVFVILCSADASLGQIPQNHFALLQNLRDMGSPTQQARWFAAVLQGHRLGNAGPERKARAARVTDATARIVRSAHGLSVSGTRFYSTGALFAHWIPFRAEDEAGRPVQVWVPHDAPGVRVIDDWDAFGQRTTASGTVVLDDVPIEQDDVLPLYAHTDRPNLSGPVSQLIQAAIDAGIARNAFADALDYVRTHTRAWVDAGVAAATDDPYIIQEVGELAIAVEAAEEVLFQAADRIDAIAALPVTAQSSAEASVAVAEAKVLTTEAALFASERLLELAGSSATRAQHNLDRHWRNARVHTLHDPVRWKHHLIGNYLLNGALPRRHQWN
ncbi:SfnB family sulfur acquisition oxidoreductase [Verticiella sediminum]|uniref:SfnB family sulfur acquisition oxidoreductase n=1 Tax=Verticiella sediminum TaxID=1247510 RepID=A0A556ANM2_9BURK|nr:SfnB family sulfur acquisition oxidoreductase [Verticiella sediminum]TSH94484.1 SfnB family sulfur acquisition oxidoreductase [Verticiella sediminum]